MKIQISEKHFIAAIIFVISILYFQSNFHQLIFLDDDTLVANNFAGLNLSEKVGLSFTSNYLGGHYYRPIALFTFVVDSMVSGQSYFSYHFTNFLIHLLTSVFIFIIIRKLGYSFLASFLPAILFSVAPIQINAVGWIAGRGDLLAAFFSVTALMIFLTFLKNRKSFLLIFVTILLFLAILSKEVALLVPFLFLILFFIERKELLLNKNSISVILMVFIVLCSYYLLRGVLLTNVHIDKFSFTAYYKNILILPETISKLFLPTGIRALPKVETFTSLSGILIFLILLLLPLKVKSINRLRYYFGFFWFVGLLIPGMVNRTMEQDGVYYWDCRSYLPLVGILFIVAEIVKVIELKAQSTRYYILIAVYLLISGTLTFIKIKLYENPVTYWNSAKADYPSNFLPYVGLYNYYNHSKDFEMAEFQLLEAIEVNPNDLGTRQILNNFYLSHSKKQKAFLLIRDGLYKKIQGMDGLLDNYILLCTELNHLDAIDTLITNYSEDNKVELKLKEVITRNVDALKEKGDSLKADLLIEKVKQID